MTYLSAYVYTAPPIPVVPAFPLPDYVKPFLPPTTSTLISSASEAILIDSLLTIDQATSLADWITTTIPNKTLTQIYITHGHGDHFFGLPTILERFPNATPIATKGMLKHMEEQISPSTWEFYTKGFPDDQLRKPDIPGKIRILDAYDLTINLEDHKLHVIPVGHSDTNDTTVLWSPDLELVVAGDTVYNGIFQYMIESLTPATRDNWIHAARQVRKLRPKSVVTGHKRLGAVDGAWTLDWTIDYLKTWGKKVKEVEKEKRGAEELFEKMKKAFPDHGGEYTLWTSAQAQFPPVQAGRLRGRGKK